MLPVHIQLHSNYYYFIILFRGFYCFWLLALRMTLQVLGCAMC